MIFNSKNILFLLLLAISCNKKEYTIDNLNNGKITKMGHAGMGITSLYPINSFESIQSCLSIGSDGTELDVQMTKDSVLVAFHDKELSTLTHLTGSVNDYKWEELKHAKYKQIPYLNYSILSLNDLFSNINKEDFKFTFG